MTTWDEVRVHVGTTFKLIYDQPTWSVLRWRFGAEDVDQRIEVSEAYREPWLQVVTDVVDQRGLDPHVALERSLTLAMGSLAIERWRYKLRCTLPVATLHLPDLDRWIELLARESLALRRAIVQRRGSPDAIAFSNYAD